MAKQASLQMLIINISLTSHMQPILWNVGQMIIVVNANISMQFLIFQHTSDDLCVWILVDDCSVDNRTRSLSVFVNSQENNVIRKELFLIAGCTCVL